MSRKTTISMPLRLIAYSCAAVTACVGTILVATNALRSWPLCLVLAAVAVVATLTQGRLSRLTTLSFTDLPLMAAIVLLQPGQAMLVAIAAGITWSGRLGIVSRLVNVTVLAVPVGLAVGVFRSLGAGLGVANPAEHPIGWFAIAIASAGMYLVAHFTLGGVWTRLAYQFPISRWLQDVVGPVMKADPFSTVLVIALVEISLLLNGPARALPALLAIAGLAGVWLSLRTARRQVQARELKDDFFRAIFVSLAKLLELKDPETAQHSARVAMFSRDLAAEMGFSDEEQSRIHLAGLLHDVGKVGVPDEILLKPGRLTPEQRAVMERHSRYSAEAIAGIPGFSDLTRMVYAHHERLDGSGYPDAVVGSDIPIGARILGVADTFEALTSDRPYRKGRTAEEALQVFDEDAHLFDEDVVGALNDLVASGLLQYEYGSMADFSDEWSRAARHLDVRPDDEPFEIPPERPVVDVAIGNEVEQALPASSEVHRAAEVPVG